MAIFTVREKIQAIIYLTLTYCFIYNNNNNNNNNIYLVSEENSKEHETQSIIQRNKIRHRNIKVYN